MFKRTRRLLRRRSLLSGLALGFAALAVVGPASAAVARPYEPQVVTTSPDYSHLPAEDRAAIFAPAPPSPQSETVSLSSTGGGIDRGDWMRGIALAAALFAASAFALIMVRGGARPAHS